MKNKMGMYGFHNHHFYVNPLLAVITYCMQGGNMCVCVHACVQTSTTNIKM